MKLIKLAASIRVWQRVLFLGVVLLLIILLLPDREDQQLADPYTFTTNSFPDDPRLWPAIGNGHISTAVHSSALYMNGLYNGYGNTSHRAHIPSPVAANVTSVNSSLPSWKEFELNTKIGIFQEILAFDECTLTLEWYTHRQVLPLLVFSIEMWRSAHASDKSLSISTNITQFGQSADIDFMKLPSHLSNGQNDVHYQHGVTKEPETTSSNKECVHVYYDDIPHTLQVEKGASHYQWTFLTAIHADKESASNAYKRGLQLLKSGRLRVSHIESWFSVWRSGNIEVEGNLAIARAIAASQYYVLSSLPTVPVDPKWPFIGLSPCGLAWGDNETYFGHVFWDQETWMYPPLLMLHADLTWQLLETRFRPTCLSSATENAVSTGFRGLRYPWESAYTGVETTPSDICATQEIHINGDIAFAMEQYWRATGSLELFDVSKSKFVEVVFGIADFWISRCTYNSATQMFEITRVQPPDEYAVNVSNSVYTNTVAKQTLQFAAEIARILQLPEKIKSYQEHADKMYIPFDANVGYHPEYDGYVRGTTVKQADVILLGFPFMSKMSLDVRLRDLEIYEPVTSVRGPAMGDSMFAIGWLEMKQYDRAVASFQKMFDHVAGEFQVWTEEKNKQGATNFITGMGGFLQAILFGFGGIRLNREQLGIDPVLPPDCNRLHFIGLDYRGSSLSLDISETNMTLTLTKQGSHQLQLLIGEHAEMLVFSKPITVPKGKAAIKAV